MVIADTILFTPNALILYLSLLFAMLALIFETKTDAVTTSKLCHPNKFSNLRETMASIPFLIPLLLSLA